MKKVYIATRTSRRQEVKDLAAALQERGYELSMDWTVHKPIKPYTEHAETAQQYALEDVKGVQDCDVLIVLSDEGGTGMYLELGIAMQRWHDSDGQSPKIYVVGEYNERSIFFFHPGVERRNTTEEVLAEL